MRIPFLSAAKVESRQDSLTDAAIAHIQAQATGAVSDVLETAALEIAAGLYGRAMAMAEITSGGPAAQAVTPPVMAMIGRQMIRKGQVVFELVVNDRGAVLMPVSTWNIVGNFDPVSWVYELTFGGPSETLTKSVDGAGVVHCRYAVDPSQPWIGKGPMQLASSTSKLTATLESKLAEEVSAAVGQLLPIPEEATDDQKAALRADIASLKGKDGLSAHNFRRLGPRQRIPAPTRLACTAHRGRSPGDSRRAPIIGCASRPGGLRCSRGTCRIRAGNGGP